MSTIISDKLAHNIYLTVCYGKNNLWKLSVFISDYVAIVICPQCRGEIQDLKIRANETGYSYCSEECAKKHVEENKPPGGY